MDFHSYLQRYGIIPAALVGEVQDRLGRRPDDILLAVGSLVEGLATTKSDLDLLLLREGDDHDSPDDNVSFDIRGCLVDVNVVPMDRYRELCRSLQDWCKSPWDLTYEGKFRQEDRKLLHRAATGMLLYPGDGDSGSGPVIPERPHPGALAQLKLHVARHNARTIQVDMEGHRDGNDTKSLVFAAEELLGHGMDALLAGHGMINPLAKWRWRLLGGLDEQWSAPLIWGYGKARPADKALWDLNRIPQRPEASTCFRYAYRAVAFARAAFVWAENQLVFPSVELRIPHRPATRSDGRSERLPCLKLDVDYSLASGRFLMARLNAVGTKCALTADEFALAMLCDGETALDTDQLRQSLGDHVSGRWIKACLDKLDACCLLSDEPIWQDDLEGDGMGPSSGDGHTPAAVSPRGDLPSAYLIRLRVPTVAEYLDLCERSGLSPVSPEQLRIGLPKSLFAVCVEHSDLIVGMGRVVGDGGVFFNIVDVAVHREHQRRGLGSAIVRELLDYIHCRADATAFVELFAANGSEPFYRRFGFARRHGDEPSMCLQVGGSSNEAHA